MKTLEQVLASYREAFPGDEATTQWAGCNYHINRGNNEMEPVGTAQSMHDCEGCHRLSYCLVIQSAPIWPWDTEKDKDLRKKWQETRRREQEQ